MHDFLTIGQIRARAKQAHLPFQMLVKAAGVDYSSFTRASQAARDGRFGGSSLATLQRLTQALTRHELRLRDHLVGLHGVPSVAGGANGEAPAPRGEGREEREAAA